MSTATLETSVIEKTKELCQAILDDPSYCMVRRQVDTFMANDAAKEQYQNLVEKGEYLNHKQQQGVQLGEAEIAEFDKERDLLFKNPIARGFMDAQEHMQKVQDSVKKYVTKTVELGHVPSEAELEEGGGGGCGSGCGCH